MATIEREHRFWIALPLVICWFVGTVYAFWWFQAKDLRSFDASAQNQGAVFAGNGLAESFNRLPANLLENKVSQALVVHFWNPDCGCNKFNNPHVRKIIEQYRKQGIAFLTVIRTNAAHDPQTLLAKAESLFNIPAVMESSLQMDSSTAPSVTPAAAVINNQGDLAYFGPYSNGAFCGADDNAFVENTLNTLLEGKTTESLNTLAFGCFCQWSAGASAQAI